MLKGAIVRLLLFGIPFTFGYLANPAGSPCRETRVRDLRLYRRPDESRCRSVGLRRRRNDSHARGSHSAWAYCPK
jgi:hypothetical protein